MKGEGHRLRAARDAAQIVEKLALAFEAIGDVIENLDLVVKRGGEGAKIAFGRSGDDPIHDFADIFDCGHGADPPGVYFHLWSGADSASRGTI